VTTSFWAGSTRYDFLKTLTEACQKTGWQVHAFCLMRNHYHVVLETPNANLVSGMAWLQSTYTIRLNHRHKLTGNVLGGRYKAQLVEGSSNGYLRTATSISTQCVRNCSRQRFNVSMLQSVNQH
jgi:REP element-mobilizing transposase RayT